MVVSSSFIQALPELLTTQREFNSSSSDLDFLLAAQKTTNGFNLVPSALTAKHKLTIHFSCPVVFKQTDFASCISIVVLGTVSLQNDISHIAIILEGRYLYLIESLRVCKIHRISLSINCSGSCCVVVILRHSEKPLRPHCFSQKEISLYHHIRFCENISSWLWYVSSRDVVHWISCHQSTQLIRFLTAGLVVFSYHLPIFYSLV